MIQKPEGKVNEIIYLNTVYNDSRYRFYPTLTQLFQLIEEIIKTNETTKFIQITPFYINEKLNIQEELTIASFYIESREVVDVASKEIFVRECMFWTEEESDYKVLEKYISLEDMASTHFLVKKSDVLDFQKSLQTYQTFLLHKGITQMMKWLVDMIELKSDDLPYGYFCFEVLSK